MRVPTSCSSHSWLSRVWPSLTIFCTTCQHRRGEGERNRVNFAVALQLTGTCSSERWGVRFDFEASQHDPHIATHLSVCCVRSVRYLRVKAFETGWTEIVVSTVVAVVQGLRGPKPHVWCSAGGHF